ncbi:MAG: hypothetical protein E3J72_07010 [Planctomycetota bacterium]|nr:MAG: hypothetical protein E3J72_07010 [Planctomycetota bacterium]
MNDEPGQDVISAHGRSLPETVYGLLKENDLTLATAESCTGGLVGHLLTEVPGISAHYLGGFITYSTTQKCAT